MDGTWKKRWLCSRRQRRPKRLLGSQPDEARKVLENGIAEARRAIKEGREAVYILREPPPEALGEAGSGVGKGALFAADSADVRPPGELNQIAALLESPGGGAG